MYVPPAFAETDRPTLYDFIEQHSFGLLVSAGDRLSGTHLPFLIERGADGGATLVGHMARANSHWQDADDQPVLAVFTGPHAYISPSWYEAERVVPTWTYISVHVSGRLKLVDDSSQVLAIVQQFVERYERNMPTPWKLDVAHPQTHQLAEMIVGFRIGVEDIQGAWKLNQHHPRQRREKVVRALEMQTDENSRHIAEWMRSQLPQEQPKGASS